MNERAIRFHGCASHNRYWDPWCLKCNPLPKVPSVAKLIDSTLRALGYRRPKWCARIEVGPGQQTLF